MVAHLCGSSFATGACVVDPTTPSIPWDGPWPRAPRAKFSDALTGSGNDWRLTHAVGRSGGHGSVDPPTRCDA